jgi:lipoyl(octanoyl) transferase
MSLQVVDWGLIDYQQALEKQLELVELVNREQSRGFLVLCTHPAVVTLGRKAEAQDVFAWQGPTIEVSRGGKATYHGPNQLVIYPIANLNFASGAGSEKDPVFDRGVRDSAPDRGVRDSSSDRGVRDLGKFLRVLADGIASVLNSEFGLKSVGKTGGLETGVWLGERKLGSIGIAVKNWVTYHGAALNIEQDASAFAGMRPCGFDRAIMLSLEEALDRKVDRSSLQAKLAERLREIL